MRFEENNTTRDLGNRDYCTRCGTGYFPSIGSCPNCPAIANVLEIEDQKKSKSCLQVQEGGSHYHQGTIQPIEYIHANDLNFFEGNAIKYVTRNRRKKSAVEDLKKAIHYIQLQLKLMHGMDSRIEYDAVPRD